MMDFKTPQRESRYIPRTEHRPASVEHRRPVPPPEAPPAAPAPHKRTKRRFRGRRWLKTLILLIIAGIIAWLAYGYISTKNQLTSLKSGQNTANSPSQQLIDKVGRLVVLPSGESPTIATVNDASKLKSQAFFANAQNGDKVLIYAKSNKAVLYRPSTDKIIEYTTVNLGDSTGAASTTTPTTTKKP